MPWVAVTDPNELAAARASLGGNGGKPVAVGTPKQRGDALADYQRAMQLGAVINDIEARFKEGPGSTAPGSFQSLGDYLPTPANRAFDTAGERLRGFVKSTQGLTGGENNTPTESQMNIGPFIPKSSDYDAVVLEKIAALRRERERGLATAIATLGGIPDANGRVTPVAGLQRAASAAPAAAAPRAGLSAPAAQPKRRLRYNPATGDFE